MKLRTATIRGLGSVLLCTLVGWAGAAAFADETVEDDRPLIAVLPLTNRSGQAAPLEEIREVLKLQLRGRSDFRLIDDYSLSEFMRRHRMRYTAGLNKRMAHRLAAELNVRAVLITSLNLYEAANPPKLGMTARLVSTEIEPRILWMHGAALAGDQAPGFFEQGIIDVPEIVLGKVTTAIAKAFPPIEEGSIRDIEAGRRKTKARGRFKPKIFFSSPGFPIATRQAGRIVVLPFSNDSPRHYAGEILTEQMIRHLVAAGADVIEPGVVRQVLLDVRQIYEEGPSVPEMDILRVNLRADLVMFGEVERYEETAPGTEQPFVDFTFRVIDTSSNQVIWSSVSYSRGNAGVFFFDAGRVATAQVLASDMTQALVETLRRKGPDAK